MALFFSSFSLYLIEIKAFGRDRQRYCLEMLYKPDLKTRKQIYAVFTPGPMHCYCYFGMMIHGCMLNVSILGFSRMTLDNIHIVLDEKLANDAIPCRFYFMGRCKTEKQQTIQKQLKKLLGFLHFMPRRTFGCLIFHASIYNFYVRQNTKWK